MSREMGSGARWEETTHLVILADVCGQTRKAGAFKLIGNHTFWVIMIQVADKER